LRLQRAFFFIKTGSYFNRFKYGTKTGQKRFFRPVFAVTHCTPRDLFVRFFVRRLRGFMGVFAVFVCCRRVSFGLVVLSLSVVVRRLTVVVCCRLVMGRSVVVVFVRWMLLSHVGLSPFAS